MRSDDRTSADLRPVTITRSFTGSAHGSVLIQAGRTTVLCTASIDPTVPSWMSHEGRGWVTAEYSMLPGSTSPRKQRDRGGRIDGRSTEIQRLLGRSLRAVVDLARLGERTVVLDCDVLEADGGTRTLSISGAFIALVDALCSIRDKLPDPTTLPLEDSVAAVSVGLVKGRPLLDLDHAEDSAASVDMNVVMTGGGRYVEIQGTGEEATFAQDELNDLLSLARTGIGRLTDFQKESLGEAWPFK